MKIDTALNSLITDIKETDLYQKYQHILTQVEKSGSIDTLVKEIKAIQKKLVHAEAKGQRIDILENELESKKQALYAIPLYQDYIAISDELRDLMKMVESKMQTYVNSLNI